MADFELNAFIEDTGTKRPFHLRISDPLKTVNSDDYYCRIHAPELFEKDKDIFGVDEEQAKALAFGFVRSLLSGKRLVDEKGQAIKL